MSYWHAIYKFFNLFHIVVNIFLFLFLVVTRLRKPLTGYLFFAIYKSNRKPVANTDPSARCFVYSLYIIVSL